MDGLIGCLRDAPQPFVAYFHLFPPHEPYCPRREFVGRFDDGWTPLEKETRRLSPGYLQKNLNQWRMEYDEYVAHTDAEFGRLNAFLARIGLLDNSIVIVTSDHGQLFERGVHGHDNEHQECQDPRHPRCSGSPFDLLHRLEINLILFKDSQEKYSLDFQLFLTSGRTPFNNFSPVFYQKLRFFL